MSRDKQRGGSFANNSVRSSWRTNREGRRVSALHHQTILQATTSYKDRTETEFDRKRKRKGIRTNDDFHAW